MGTFLNFKAMFYMIKKDLTIKMRYKIDSLSILLRPIAGILPLLLFSSYIHVKENTFFHYTGTDKYISYIAITYFFITYITHLMVSSSILITSELQQGTFETLMLSPVNAIYLLIGDMISAMVVQIIDFFLFYFLISIIFGEGIGFYDLSSMFFIIIIASLVAFGLGILLAGITIKTKLTKITFMINSILIFLAGVSYPITVFPTWLKYVALVNPITYCVDLMRYSILGTITYMKVPLEMSIIFVYSVCLFVVAVFIYMKIIRGLKVKGTLTNY
ncbi:hypothetical protein BBF96_09450 [Anoxybacter fermentans]|uniref:Transport permease protein n=1 Tax=Anoxybacter fermentans TaxID=1323375 RepID=A0A3S9SZ80_9FIRM|nr:ABC transporter permease [Anoxybacter fermentans]AZR73594.1 hypothetical protein BBF96_09450 [Anoxybacter fermentans]